MLERYARGELAPDQTTGLEAHLETCATCREEVAHHQRRAGGELPAEPKTAPGNPSVPVAAFGSGVALDVEAPIQLTNLVATAREPEDPAAETEPLDQPITALRPTLAPGPGGSTLFLERGTRVGRYVILEQIGSGGMGVVYAAMDPELDRKVALKLLRSTGNDAPGAPSEARVRLLREAQAMARLSHPNVITIHDVGSHFSQVYLAMELVQGTTLTEWLRAKRTWREVVRVFCKAGQGLAAAHQAGLVHRDFKPDNVLVGDDGSVHVMDFGLARAATRDEGDRPWRAPDPQSGAEFLLSALTRQGTVVGTPTWQPVPH
ncbi:MAG TPA: protein kinase [Longimicrobium sp.]|nr:protein kinase [Longimicrobium sp.]